MKEDMRPVGVTEEAGHRQDKMEAQDSLRRPLAVVLTKGLTGKSERKSGQEKHRNCLQNYLKNTKLSVFFFGLTCPTTSSELDKPSTS